MAVVAVAAAVVGTAAAAAAVVDAGMTAEMGVATVVAVGVGTLDKRFIWILTGLKKERKKGLQN